MSNQHGELSDAFVAQQRVRLLTIRRELLGTEQSTIADEQSNQKEQGDEAKEYEDEAQDLAQREIGQSLRDASDHRIGDVQRALQKIDEGTYGFSDESGEQIPEARLEVMPEAIYTIAEQARREAGG